MRNSGGPTSDRLARGQAEEAERYNLSTRNTNQMAVTATQGAGETLSGLARVREAAKRDKNLRFNNLQDIS